MRGFFGWGVYNGIETQPGGGEDVQEQEIIAQLLQQDERVWNKIAQFDPARGSWNAWLTAITRNTARNYQRSAQHRPGTQSIPEGTPAPDASPEEAILQAERSAALHDALARLGQNDRALFYRKYYYLQSTAQIASELGMTVRAVEGRLYRLKKQLRRMLGGEGHV